MAASQRKGSVSRDTQALVQSMMKQAKLTPFQQRQLKAKLQAGGPLPKALPPTSSKTAPKKGPQKPAGRTKPLNPRNYKGGKRMDVGKAERDSYRPTRAGVDRELEKDKLGDVMAFGSDVAKAKADIRLGKGTRRPPTTKAAKQFSAEDFDQTVAEIEERREFLRQMESLGRGKEHQARIDAEISQKVRQLEVIDQKRNAELRLLEESAGGTS